jgi:predicted dehydrogenase
MVFDPYQSRLQICADETPFQSPDPHPRDPMGMWKHTQNEVELLPKQSWISTGDESWQNREFSAFIDAVEAGKEGEMHAALAAQSIAVITAGYQSAASGRTISID